MLRTHVFKPQPTITFNPEDNQRLISIDADTVAANMTQIAGMKYVRAGAILATDSKLLKRAKLLTSAADGQPNIYVNNPWAFAVGDALRIIATPGQSAATELAAITGATGTSLGTISAIETNETKQTSQIGLTTAVVGNLITINFSGVVATYTVKSTTIADEVIGLAAAIRSALQSVEWLKYIKVTALSAAVQLEGDADLGLLEFTASLSQGSGGSLGAISNTTLSGLGRITLSANLGAAIAQGTKIGVVTQIPLGIFDSEFDFGYYPQSIPPETSLTPLYAGKFYRDALPYLDGQITATLNGAAFIPAYS